MDSMLDNMRYPFFRSWQLSNSKVRKYNYGNDIFKYNENVDIFVSV